MAKYRKRHPQTKAALREKAAGTIRPGRGYIPTERDDLAVGRQRSWKKFRKTKYRPADPT
jgi:hypothetical protein